MHSAKRSGSWFACVVTACIVRVADDPLAVAQSIAAEIADRSPDAVRAAKRLYDEAWTGDAEETLSLEASAQRRLIGSQNQIAAVTAGMTKEPPEFADPEPAGDPETVRTS